MIRAIVIGTILLGLAACAQRDPYRWSDIARGVGQVSKESNQ